VEFSEFLVLLDFMRRVVEDPLILLKFRDACDRAAPKVPSQSEQAQPEQSPVIPMKQQELHVQSSGVVGDARTKTKSEIANSTDLQNKKFQIGQLQSSHTTTEWSLSSAEEDEDEEDEDKVKYADEVQEVKNDKMAQLQRKVLEQEEEIATLRLELKRNKQERNSGGAAVKHSHKDNDGATTSSIPSSSSPSSAAEPSSPSSPSSSSIFTKGLALLGGGASVSARGSARVEPGDLRNDGSVL
jgi:hypothetical protein